MTVQCLLSAGHGSVWCRRGTAGRGHGAARRLPAARRALQPRLAARRLPRRAHRARRLRAAPARLIVRARRQQRPHRLLTADPLYWPCAIMSPVRHRASRPSDSWPLICVVTVRECLCRAVSTRVCAAGPSYVCVPLPGSTRGSDWYQHSFFRFGKRSATGYQRLSKVTEPQFYIQCSILWLLLFVITVFSRNMVDTSDRPLSGSC